MKNTDFRKKAWAMLLAALMAFMASGCGGADDALDQAANIAQAEDEHIQGVKNGTSTVYPGKTFGNAFDSFFTAPAWKYFVGTKEGTDEDGDGKPDSTEENVDVVEFTGYCTYQNVEVKALVQFTLSKERDTFEATYLSFNGVPQNMLMLSALMEAVFTDSDVETQQQRTKSTAQGSGAWERGTENPPAGRAAWNAEKVETVEISGHYAALTGDQTVLDISIYSSPESEMVGNADAGPWHGTIAEIETNVYQLYTGTEQEVIFEISRAEDGTIIAVMYVDGQLIEEYGMIEHYES